MKKVWERVPTPQKVKGHPYLKIICSGGCYRYLYRLELLRQAQENFLVMGAIYW